jgi:hypothetical protein
MIQIREAAGQLANDQSQREDTSRRLEELIAGLDETLDGVRDGDAEPRRLRVA